MLLCLGPNHFTEVLIPLWGWTLTGERGAVAVPRTGGFVLIDLSVFRLELPECPWPELLEDLALGERPGGASQPGHPCRRPPQD